MDQFLSLASVLFFLLLGYATLWYIVSIFLERNDVADIAWGLGYCLICLYLYLVLPRSEVSTLLYCLVILWGFRLSVHIYLRNRGKKEDFRYLKWRTEWGKLFYLRSYFQVYLLQAFFLFVIISPVVWASVNASLLDCNWFTAVGLGVWIIGFFFQSVGDYQLSQFVKHRTDSSEIMSTGLWKYSRHPNYFGEILMWWGIYLVVIQLPGAWLFAVSPITITLLLRYVSGVPMLEEKYASNKAFLAYKKKTPVLFPKFW